MLNHVACWLVTALVVVCFGLVGLFVFAEMGRGRLVPMVAGFVLGSVFGAGLVGYRTWLFDLMFPPAVGEPGSRC